jgi:hypothetical protein
MHGAIEYERSASRVQGDFEDAVFPFHPHVLVFVVIAVEHGISHNGQSYCRERLPQRNHGLLKFYFRQAA